MKENNNNQNQITITLFPGTVAWLMERIAQDQAQDQSQQNTVSDMSVSGLIQAILTEYRHKNASVGRTAVPFSLSSVIKA